jgi:hypothetical protein
MIRAHQIAATLSRIQHAKPFFWRPPFGFFEQAPLTDDMIGEAERKLGLRLPVALLAILKLQNGGSPRYDTYGSASQRNDVGLDHLYGIGPPVPKVPLVIEDSARWIADWDENRQPNLVETAVMLAGDFHWWVGLDYRPCGPQGEPVVIYVNNEALSDEKRITQLAVDFDRFVDGLYDGRTEHAYGFVTAGDDSKPLRTALERCLGVKSARARKADYPEPGTRDKPGYVATHPTWHRWLPGAKTPATLRLRRNKYAKPAGHLEFPLNPECDWLLECDIHRDFREELERRLAEIPYTVVPLHLPPWDKLGW